ncbi:hypothetical protein [Streptomyces qinzhouensis]|uniref:Uncharacterized protein n=1 Tax=Streptomyces qinzhouensis TaxID=2599401 RepID=A0A5B8J267_9ACTN|nr:hypothetical protein [Streptomyces qinzhouensis]QDY75327.1 hypothetical protein FQU76_01115 [Streptomyces qinzhouensis]
MNRHTITRGIGALAAAFGLTLGTSGQASAATQFLWTYRSGSLCVSGYSEISAGVGGGGFSKSATYTYQRDNSVNCSIMPNKPAGWISLESHLLAFNMPKGIWYVCGDKMGPYRNGVPAFSIGLSRNTHRACGGDVWYATHTAAYAWGGVSWLGGWVASGNHWVPWAGRAGAAPQKEPRISAAEAVKRGEVRIGGPDGPRATAAQLQPKPIGGPGTKTTAAPGVGITVHQLSHRTLSGSRPSG